MFKIYKIDEISRFDTLVEGIKNILEFEGLDYKIIIDTGKVLKANNGSMGILIEHTIYDNVFFTCKSYKELIKYLDDVGLMTC